MKRLMMRTGAAVGTTAILALAAGPALAAAPVSQATSNGLVISLAGTPATTGTATATNDGTAETKTGQSNPPISVLQGQSLITTGVVAQEADATVVNHDGHAAACAGLAGPGAAVAAVGDTSCLTPGSAVSLSLGNIDLSKLVVIDPTSALSGIGTLVNSLGVPGLLNTVTAALSKTLTSAGLPTTGLTADLGAVQAVCHTTSTTASGSANLADVSLGVDVAGTKVNILTLPANPPVNGPDVNADLTALIDPILAALTADLKTSLNGALGAVAGVTQQLQDNVIDAIVPQLSKALQPLTSQILSLKLNQQIRTGNNKIEVNALNLKVLPALASAGISSLLGLQIGHVVCGPNGRTAVPTTTPTTPNPTAVPTSVPAGLAGSPVQHDNHALLIGSGALAVLLALGSGTGLAIYRRHTAGL